MQDHSATAHAAIKVGMRPRHSPKIKRAATTLLTMLALSLPAWLIAHHYSPSYLFADIRTASAEWQSTHLSDNSQVTLNGNTAVDVDFTPANRTLHLLRGEILVEVAKDATRPFVVKTAHGSITALGTRFVVNHGEHATSVSMLESSVAVRPGHHDSQTSVVRQGEAVTVFENSVSRPRSIDADSLNDAWRLHQLVVQDQPLPDVLAALSRHRSGYLRFDTKQLAQYQVTAVLPLDDTDKALQLLGESFPLRLRYFTPWLIMVDPVMQTEKSQ